MIRFRCVPPTEPRLSWLDAFLRGSLSLEWPRLSSGRSSFSRMGRGDPRKLPPVFKRRSASYSLRRTPSRCSRCRIRGVGNQIRRYNVIISVIIIWIPHLWSKMGSAPLVQNQAALPLGGCCHWKISSIIILLLLLLFLLCKNRPKIGSTPPRGCCRWKIYKIIILLLLLLFLVYENRRRMGSTPPKGVLPLGNI